MGGRKRGVRREIRRDGEGDEGGGGEQKTGEGEGGWGEGGEVKKDRLRRQELE